MVVIVDGQNVSGIISYLILQRGIDFRSIIWAAFCCYEKGDICIISQAKIIYRDTIKGQKKYQGTVNRHKALVSALKTQGIEVRDAPQGIRKSPRKTYNLDPLIEDDLKQAIKDPATRTIILLSGDGDFAPYAEMARQKGIIFIVIGSDGSISSRLEENADQTFRIQNLIPVLKKQI